MRMARFPMALLPSYRFFFGSLTSDLKVASRRRTANTSYPCRRRASELLEVWLDDRALSIPVDGVPDGPARLFMRPQDVAVVDESAGAIAGVVTATHRNGGLRRFDLAIGGALPRRWRLYPAGVRYSKTLSRAAVIPGSGRNQAGQACTSLRRVRAPPPRALIWPASGLIKAPPHAPRGS